VRGVAGTNQRKLIELQLFHRHATGERRSGRIAVFEFKPEPTAVFHDQQVEFALAVHRPETRLLVSRIRQRDDFFHRTFIDTDCDPMNQCFGSVKEPEEPGSQAFRVARRYVEAQGSLRAIGSVNPVVFA